MEHPGYTIDGDTMIIFPEFNGKMDLIYLAMRNITILEFAEDLKHDIQSLFN